MRRDRHSPEPHLRDSEHAQGRKKRRFPALALALGEMSVGLLPDNWCSQKGESLGRVTPGGIHEKAKERRPGRAISTRSPPGRTLNS